MDDGEQGEDEGDQLVMLEELSNPAAEHAPLRLPRRVLGLLYPHQRDGLSWLWALHCTAAGGILADDMGSGKTIQVCAFLSGLFHSNLIKRALIVAPNTALTHWVNELSAVGLKEHIRDYSGNDHYRAYQLHCTFKEGGLLLTTYEVVRKHYMLIRGNSHANADGHEEEILWDYVILDEGHVIKNPKTQRAHSLFQIPSAHRIILTGTPVQNDLKEMWALFYFCCPFVLGDKDEFKLRYEMPILRGNDKNATDQEKHVCSNAAKELRERIKPYFLRRMKSEVFVNIYAKEDKRPPLKNELVIWLKLTSCQENVDKRLQISQEAACKIAFILPLLRNLVEEGHNVLVFSQTHKMLNLIQDALTLEGHKFLRIDGITKVYERAKIVKDFQEGPGATVLLLTSQVGGLGNALTKADRVIVVDPAWNPSTDNRSVDRAFRIGQTKDVIAYRLVTCGTIEEKIYRLQVFKEGLLRTATEQNEQPQYSRQEDIRKISTFPSQGFDVSLSQHQMQEQHDQQLVMDGSLRKHIQFLKQQGIAGVSHHSVLFSKTSIMPTLNDEDAVHRKLRDIMARRYYALRENTCSGTERKSLMAEVKETWKKMERITDLEQEYTTELVGMLHENKWGRSHLEKTRVQIDHLHEEYTADFNEMLERIQKMELAEEKELIAELDEMVERMGRRSDVDRELMLSLPSLVSYS